MSEQLFRQDAYLQSTDAVVTACGPEGIELDRTVFYPAGGGQPGDSGTLRRADGTAIAIADTRKGPAPNQVLHVPASGQALPAPASTSMSASSASTRRRSSAGSTR